MRFVRAVLVSDLSIAMVQLTEDKMMHHPRVGIGVLILDSQNRLLLGQRKNAHRNESWGPPGGHLEFGESFEECARREILEETGLYIDKTFYLNLTNDVFIQEQCHYISIFMIGRCPKEQHPQACEPHKTASWQ
jgi:8-oxo-dGTP diphosphatase